MSYYKIEKQKLEQNLNDVQKMIVPTSSQTIAKPNVVGSDVKTGIGVFCQCGGIIYAVTDDCYKTDKQSRKDVDALFDKGYRTGKVSKSEVQELFGCKCKHTAPRLF